MNNEDVYNINEVTVCLTCGCNLYIYNVDAHNAWHTGTPSPTCGCTALGTCTAHTPKPCTCGARKTREPCTCKWLPS